MKQKLFVWYNIRRDYTQGIGFAIARTKEEAIRVIKENSEAWEWNAYKGDLMDEPKVYEGPFGYWMSGGS